MSEAGSSAVARRPCGAWGRVGFVGAGRVGGALALAWPGLGAGAAVTLCRPRSGPLPAWAEAATSLDWVDDAATVVRHCDTVWLTVADDALAPCSAALPWRPGQRVIHTSGATELQALAPAARSGAVVAGFHPLRTFGPVGSPVALSPGTAVAIECGHEATRADLHELACAWGWRPFALPPGARAAYHASAHFAGALVVAMMKEATGLWRQWGVDEAQALQALLPLLDSTVKTMREAGLARGMAGVVARGDAAVLQRHLQALAGQPDTQALYTLLSRRTLALAEEAGRLNPSQRAALASVLSGSSVDTEAPPPKAL